MVVAGIAGCMLVVDGTFAPVPATELGVLDVIGDVVVPVGVTLGAAVPAVRPGMLPIIGDVCGASLLHAHAPSTPTHANKIDSRFVITE
jgi:hypothetical protein